MKQHSYSVISGNVSLATSQNLSAIPVATAKNVGIQLVFTGTPAGAFKLQVSNDSKNAAPTNWTDVADSSETIAAAGDLDYEYADISANWVRVVWTASGAGTTPVLTVANAVIKS